MFNRATIKMVVALVFAHHALCPTYAIYAKIAEINYQV
jgi:hypothetical protein